jgi:short-subunit dehydrogenase
MIDVNFGGAVAFAACVVPQLLQQGEGQIGFVASVAGYRGLPKSLIYGPTKAALINFAEALYLDLHPKGIGVRVINPGFVATPLTAQNDFAMPALLTPEQAAVETLAGFAGSAFRNPLSEALHLGAQTARASAVPNLFPVASSPRWISEGVLNEQPPGRRCTDRLFRGA